MVVDETIASKSKHMNLLLHQLNTKFIVVKYVCIISRDIRGELENSESEIAAWKPIRIGSIARKEFNLQNE